MILIFFKGPTYICIFSILIAHTTSSIEFQSVLQYSGMWQKEKKRKFDSYYLKIRMVKNLENSTMAFIQCVLEVKLAKTSLEF
jgi:hypothetical protein